MSKPKNRAEELLDELIKGKTPRGADRKRRPLKTTHQITC
ncbi:hypothetical protein LEP1GSC062_3208 [Leptospira alexanderi serovar Manhao 3 str. L 60]|uniref:Uncharacterized protein n=1 Tax=Leptospira alexanderi serovar Manhao 3 str. L 60 TaxID=1049759 RepID=V6ICF3_9LEPT|nr:hypothetical protein LEP1GSC062_3208 [Leptospira alexanderi serovar Manhao 3 str. L 60]